MKTKQKYFDEIEFVEVPETYLNGSNVRRNII